MPELTEKDIRDHNKIFIRVYDRSNGSRKWENLPDWTECGIIPKIVIPCSVVTA